MNALEVKEDGKAWLIIDYPVALQEYLDTGIEYTANSLKNADVGDLQQLASDSFFHGYKLQSKPLIGERSAEEILEQYAPSKDSDGWIPRLLAIKIAKEYASQFKGKEDSLEETDAKFSEASKKIIQNAPTKTYSIKELESFAIEFADYMRCECWEYDHMGQKTHSTSEHLAHFKEKYFPK